MLFDDFDEDLTWEKNWSEEQNNFFVQTNEKKLKQEHSASYRWMHIVCQRAFHSIYFNASARAHTATPDKCAERRQQSLFPFLSPEFLFFYRVLVRLCFYDSTLHFGAVVMIMVQMVLIIKTEEEEESKRKKQKQQQKTQRYKACMCAETG